LRAVAVVEQTFQGQQHMVALAVAVQVVIEPQQKH
jgi:hypothetical protein